MQLWTRRYAPDMACGLWIRENTPEDARVLTSSASPTALYFCGRTGWTCWARTYGTGAAFKLNYTNEVIRQGATHLAVPDPNFDNAWIFPQSGLRDWLYDTYRCYKMPDFTVFFLGEKPGLGLPPEGLDFGTLAARPYLRGTWGPDQEGGGGRFVAMGPSSRGGVRAVFPQRVTFEVASAVLAQHLSLRCGEVVKEVHLPKAGIVKTVDVDLPASSAPRTVVFEASRRNGLGASILLYRVIPGHAAPGPL